jgi:hypothetical protein
LSKRPVGNEIFDLPHELRVLELESAPLIESLVERDPFADSAIA